MSAPAPQGRLKRLYLHTTQGYAGPLSRESQYVFSYHTDDPQCEISLTMPLQAESYSANVLPGVLRQNLPEGYLRDWFRERLFSKLMKMDDFNLLALTGGEMIGRVRCAGSEQPPDHGVSPISLKDLLTWKGTESLFDYLAERYALNSGISGVQPKVLVPATRDDDAPFIEKSALRDRRLIVKSAGEDFPGLPENEYHCMSIARKAGLVVPNFWLSDDRSLFIMERFDILPDGRYLGFEDLTALTGRRNEDKYLGSYEMAAKAVSLFSSRDYEKDSLIALFSSVVLSVSLRNGDAHLKNFGMLYTSPQTNDVRLSPLYDVVNTTCYIQKDIPALKLAGAKSWPDRESLAAFGREYCALTRPEDIIDRICEAAMSYRPEIEPGDIWKRMQPEIERGCGSLSRGRLLPPQFGQFW
ncbi:type II toxin-antitoxin system HipA family toxin [Noviherbaspirillum aridicola]|uniref:HipA family protein n=1 Tax=Noviherbaspirillum aridicola TaxID=2849687 RepID=A0ABQ4Q629_9BURK|nr:type II toxin-antitoxin system HipA family toxin [Noviherbaspirillum aridicola]GIZ52658.1 hipA family protein [Noviherbaspirillum aridicola]